MMSPLHHRMPVILCRDAEGAWLDPAVTDASAATAVIRPLPEEALVYYPVSTAVNNVRHEGPELVERWTPPIEPQQASLF